MKDLKYLIKEVLDNVNTHILSKTPEEIIKYLGNNFYGFNTKQDAIEELEYLINTKFPSGFKDIPNHILLYRLLLVKDNESINEKEIGEHFIAEPNLIDVGFLEKIGVWDYWTQDSKLWLLTCKVNKDNIDFDSTIGHRLIYPRENEFTLLSSTKVTIVNKEVLKKKNIQY